MLDFDIAGVVLSECHRVEMTHRAMRDESMKRKKILLIKPRATSGLWGIDVFKVLPQSLMNLGSLVVEHCHDWDVEVIDNNFEEIPHEVDADLVGITMNTSQAVRGYRIADALRNNGVPVIVGGVHPTYCPEEAAKHADSVIMGEAEEIFPEVLNDFANNNLKASYAGGILHDLSLIPKQDYSLFDKYNYYITNVVQATRGCPIRCDFCSVTQFNGAKVRLRPIEDVLEAIQNIIRNGKRHLGRRGIFFFADDNVFINKKYAKELFTAMIPLNVRWATQSSIYIARDKELLELAYRSGCRALLIGFESIHQESLNQINKKYHVNEYAEMINRIHQVGIQVDASIIFGFEHEAPSIIQDTVDFLIENEVELAQFSILTPYPGSDYHKKMDEEGRIIHQDWNKYDQFHMVTDHPSWPVEKLNEELLNAYRKFYSYSSIFQRIKRLFFKKAHYGIMTAIMNLQYRAFNPNKDQD